MALYTKKQFAQLADIKTKDLSNYIKRGASGNGNGVVMENDLIDDTHPKNILFLQKRKLKGVKKSPPVTQKRQPVIAPPGREQQKKVKKDPAQVENEEAVFKNMDLKNYKLQEEIDLLKAKKEKIYEQVIPREHASFLIKNYSESIKSVWLTATETFLTQVGTSLQLSRQEIIDHKKYINEIVNEAIKSGAEAANNRIRKAAKEFAGRKGKGEHE